MKAAFQAALLVAVALVAGPVRADATDPYPQVAAAYALAVDSEALWAHGADLPLPPASLAKLLAALVLLRDPAWDGEAVVTASHQAAAIEGTQLGLRNGDQLRASDAMTALLLRSANDACIALAEHAAGTVVQFLAKMNSLAQQLGMVHSVFKTPCGLDAAGQFSTASDLLILARAAMANPEIRRRVALPRAAIKTIAGKTYTFTNNNALIGRLDGTIGLKSGFTSKAGKCVIVVAERSGRRVWLVMLNAPNRWWAADGMIQAAFAELETP
jgi:serine-type D-Ala-D-Ala carboxypeptidase (penicillin-binding protein 5/6)